MTEGRPAGFWIRALAALIDFVVFFLVQVSFGFVGAKVWGADVQRSPAFLPMVWFFTFVFSAAYTTLLLALGGQTIGKMLTGVRVVVGGGEPPSIGAALLRYIGYFVSLGSLSLGYLMAGLRHDKRALHDLIAGTRVERVSRASAEAPVAPPPPAETADAPSTASGTV